MTVLVGRGTSEKVTAESSFSTIEGPTPFTRLNPSIEPNGPNESRSATIRLARVGPICRRPSISASLATSRSTFPTALGAVFFRGWRPGLRRPARRAESAALIWVSSAVRAAESAGWRLCSARHARVEAPSVRTIEKKRSAFRSAGVGTVGRLAGPCLLYVTEAARVGAYSSIVVVRKRVPSTSTPATTNGKPRPR